MVVDYEPVICCWFVGLSFRCSISEIHTQQSYCFIFNSPLRGKLVLWKSSTTFPHININHYVYSSASIFVSMGPDDESMGPDDESM